MVGPPLCCRRNPSQLNDIVRRRSCIFDCSSCDHSILLCTNGSIRCFYFPCALPDASVAALAALAGDILLTFVGSDAAGAWEAAAPVLAFVVSGGATAWRAARSLLRCWVYAAVTCVPVN
jgi:hypothetical protein